MSANPQIGRSKAWRQRQSRRIRAKVGRTANWFADTVLKRSHGEKLSPLAGAKEHQHGKLTLIQRQRQMWAMNSELRDELMGASAA